MLNELECSVQALDAETAVISLSGDMTHGCDEMLHQAYAQACNLGACNIIFDFTEAVYVDTSALAILIEFIVAAHRRRQHLLMAAPNAYLQRTFSMVGITQYATVVDTLIDAKNQAFARKSRSQVVNPAAP